MNKMKIGVARFQDMVARAAKGASENKLLPITSMMELRLEKNVFSITSTDTANTLKVMADKIEGDDFVCVVPVQRFCKLAAKLTSDQATLNFTGDKLIINANGEYIIDLPQDEDGLVQFPTYRFDKGDDEGKVINLSSIKDILAVNKPSVATSIETPSLCGYYLGSQVITTNEHTICFNDMDLMDGDEHLISPEMMDLLSLFKEEKIRWWYKDGYFLFETADVILYGAEHDGKDLFPAEEVKGYLEESFPSRCKLPKIALQDCLARLEIFIEPYDKNGAFLTFTKDGVKVNSKKQSAEEPISYTESDNFAPFRCCADISMLKALVDAHSSEVVDLWYGHPACIKLTSGKVTQVLALLDDEDDNG